MLRLKKPALVELDSPEKLIGRGTRSLRNSRSSSNSSGLGFHFYAGFKQPSHNSKVLKQYYFYKKRKRNYSEILQNQVCLVHLVTSKKARDSYTGFYGFSKYFQFPFKYYFLFS